MGICMFAPIFIAAASVVVPIKSDLNDVLARVNSECKLEMQACGDAVKASLRRTYAQILNYEEVAVLGIPYFKSNFAYLNTWVNDAMDDLSMACRAAPNDCRFVDLRVDSGTNVQCAQSEPPNKQNWNRAAVNKCIPL